MSRLELWSSGPKPDPGLHFHGSNKGTLPALAGSPDSDTRSWSPAVSLALPVWPLTCEMGCGVCLTVTMVGGGGLWERLTTVLRAPYLLVTTAGHDRDGLSGL